MFLPVLNGKSLTTPLPRHVSPRVALAPAPSSNLTSSKCDKKAVPYSKLTPMDNLRHDMSYMEFGNIYFWTATINKWNKLLLQDSYKNVVISSLAFLSSAGKIDVFAFVIMPNHVHFIWRINEMNGKEAPQGSFLKYTAHAFKKKLLYENPTALGFYSVDSHNKKYEFWQTRPMAIHLYSPDVAYQKLDYLHRNPVGEHWRLADDFCDYPFSSARFYEMDIKEYAFLKDLRYEL